MNTSDNYIPLPDPAKIVEENVNIGGGWVRHERVAYYTAHQLRSYVEAELRRLHAENESLRAERERNLDSIHVSNEIINKKNAELESLRTGYAAARLEIESLRARSAEPVGEYPALPKFNAGAVAGSGEVVAHRVMRKSISGEWASDARDWSDGPPSRALVDSICADKGRWRIDVAYAAPTTHPAPQPLPASQE